MSDAMVTSRINAGNAGDAWRRDIKRLSTEMWQVSDPLRAYVPGDRPTLFDHSCSAHRPSTRLPAAQASVEGNLCHGTCVFDHVMTFVNVC
jgi:hypothetical protein